MKYLKSTGILLVLCGTVLSCTRAKNDNAKIVFEVPGSEQRQKAQFSLLSFTELDLRWRESVVLQNQWSSIVPTGFNGVGTHPINCYAFMVGGRDPQFNVNYCGNKGSNGELTEKLFSFGPWVGAIPANGTSTQVQMEITAGSDRTFYLVGFHALDPAACVDFRKFSPEQIELTKPIVVGKVTGVKLDPGTTTNISIPQKLVGADSFEDCYFEESTGDDSERLPEPQTIAMERFSDRDVVLDHFLFANDNLGINFCTPFKVFTVDKYMRPARTNVQMNASIDYCMATTTGNCYDGSSASLAHLATYDTYSSCKYGSFGGGQFEFIIPAGNDYVVRWIHNPPYEDNRDHHVFLKAKGMLQSKELSNVAPRKYIVRHGYDHMYFQINGPKKILVNSCSAYSISYIQYYGNMASGTDWDTVFVEAWNSALGEWEAASGATIHNNGLCTTPFVIPEDGTSNGTTVYLKAQQSGKYRLVASATGINDDPGYIYFEIVSGSTQVQNLKPLGKLAQAWAGSPSCLQQRIQMLNEHGARVVATSPMTFQLQGYGASGAQFFSNGSSCSAGVGAINTVTVGAGESDFSFYVRSTNYGDKHIQIKSEINRQIFLEYILHVYNENP